MQLAIAGGYEVFPTASPKNFDYLQKLGASRTFDYNSKTVIDDLVLELKDKQFAGLLHAAGARKPALRWSTEPVGPSLLPQP